jgi:hypothetical protein
VTPAELVGAMKTLLLEREIIAARRAVFDRGI